MKATTTSLLLILLFLISQVSIATATENPSTIYVSADGDDVQNGFTPLTAKRTLNSALRVASNGCTIHLAPGTYHLKSGEAPIIQNKVSIEAENINNTILNCEYENHTLEIGPNGVVAFSNLQLRLGEESIVNQGQTEFNHCNIQQTLTYHAGILNYGKCIVTDSLLGGVKSYYSVIVNYQSLYMGSCTLTTHLVNQGQCTLLEIV